VYFTSNYSVALQGLRMRKNTNAALSFNWSGSVLFMRMSSAKRRLCIPSTSAPLIVFGGNQEEGPRNPLNVKRTSSTSSIRVGVCPVGAPRTDSRLPSTYQFLRMDAGEDALDLFLRNRQYDIRLFPGWWWWWDPL